MALEQKVDVLLVDDRPENLLALEATLCDLPLNLIKARSGKEALRFLLKWDFALILLDAEMPELDGFQTAELIRRRERSRNTPIVFITAVNKADMHVFRGYSVGAVDYILKPFEPEILKSKVLVFVELFKKTEQIKSQAKLLEQSNLELERTNKKILELYREIESKNSELNAERDFLSTVLQTVACLVVILDQEGKVKRFNNTCEQLTGYSFEEVRGRSVWDLFLPLEQRESAKAAFERFQSSSSSAEVESEWITRDGRRRTIAWTYMLLEGNVESSDVLATGMDITERLRAEEERLQLIREQTVRLAAEASQRRSAFLADASAELVCSLDSQEILRKAVRLAIPFLADWCVAYTFKDNGSLQMPTIAHADPEKEEALRTFCSLLPASAGAGHPAFKVRRTEQTLLLPEISDRQAESLAGGPEQLSALKTAGLHSLLLVPVVSRGNTQAVIGFAAATSRRRFTLVEQDLAEDLVRRVALTSENARLYEELQQASHAKDQFLATVSHELRTPLNAILGWARILRNVDLDETAATRALETIERNVKAQAQLIDDILDVSRIIVGKLRLNFHWVEVAPLIEAALDTVRPAAEIKGIELDSQLDVSAGMVSGDADRLQQIAWNLLSNAIKFTPKGGQVQVRLKRASSQLQIVVSDSGNGIAPEFLPHIFERFTQADSSTTRSHSGLGLGLAIVRHLVELHGGTIKAESQGVGHGAVFTVNLPIRAIQQTWEEDLRTRRKTEAVGSNLLRDVHVLVVDDEVDACELLTLVLTREGATVRSVMSASAALDSIAQSLPDVIICDIGMPGEDGYSFIHKLRRLPFSQGGLVPAIALTAYSSSEDRKRALLAGFQYHLPKPVELPELMVTICRIVGRNESSAEVQASAADI